MKKGLFIGLIVCTVFLSGCGEDKKAQMIITEAHEDIDNFDVMSAWKKAQQLPDKYNTDREDLCNTINRMCYDETFIVKVSNVVSKMPRVTDDDAESNMIGSVTLSNEFSDEDSLSVAMSEYYDYLNKYYILKDSNNDSAKASLGNVALQKFIFEDELGNEIQLNAIASSGLLEDYSMTIVLEKDADYRGYDWIE